jgi:hypothetical protein
MPRKRKFHHHAGALPLWKEKLFGRDVMLLDDGFVVDDAALAT